MFCSQEVDVRIIRGRDSKPRLPKGAEAALWSIIEATPDPRNHLALTRDLTGEVRIADIEMMQAQMARCRPVHFSRSA